MIRTLLIANRGEIACRIIRTAKRMGIATVAVYSDADAGAPHVAMVDEAVPIGAAAPARSYLDATAVLTAAKASGADAIHPGYGFLSENAEFAEACVHAGLMFVGPPAEAIRAMGDKSRAKALMRQAGVPVVPGYEGGDQSIGRLAAEAERIGFPVLVKAAAGGGGRGMRRVDGPGQLAEMAEGARREAESAFGDGTLLIEKLVAGARHIEVQVFGDRHGNIVHLGERDCSTQRRHQKIIEETPSPFVDASLRDAMCLAAIDAARAVGYVGAGTVEFIVGPDRTFHFIEMNTRLQVEHPVTEMATGLDLVEWQLRVAGGEALPLRQADIAFSGHAIEARLCAEDPAAGFAPQTGRISYWRPNTPQEGVRIDHGIAEGDEITPHYDPMVAKVIAHGATRAEAIARLRAALLATPLLGVVTNRQFLLELLGSDAFGDGAVTTETVDTNVSDIVRPEAGEDAFALAAAVLALAEGGDWFASTGRTRCPLTLRCGGETRHCAIDFERGRIAGIEVGGNAVALDGLSVRLPSVRYRAGGVERSALALLDGRGLWLHVAGTILRFDEPDPLERRPAVQDDRLVVSPVAGLLRHLAVEEGDRVADGDLIAVIEAMKMETPLTARLSGCVGRIGVRGGEQVAAGEILIEIVPDI